jgi:glycosyltransferase involved in cell wall biosynthesis
MTHRLDILICCHNDAALLPNAFEGLLRQTVPPGTFRVLLVDNASTDDLQSVVTRYAGRLNIDFIAEPALGLNRARNTGYRHAQTAFVAHLDADTIPDPSWVESILSVVENVDCDLCGGPYRPFYLAAKPDWLLDAFLSHDFGNEAKFLTGRQHPHGMNMVWKRETVARAGGFATDLGLTGRGLVRGDETELVSRCRRLLPAFSVYYHPGISVQTLARTEVLEFSYWLRRYFVQGRMCPTIWGERGPGMKWPWPVRGVLASTLLVTMFLKNLVWRGGRHIKTAMFQDVLPALFHLGSTYQELLDTWALIFRVTKRSSR